jgi:RNA polymerase sigma-70 factor (ECF subfamily)
MPTDDCTTVIQSCIDRLVQGDESARAALLGCASARLSRLARKMLHNFPGVARWEQTDDVLQNALIRLDRSLRSVVPATSRDFFRLAAAQIRRELVDLARHYQGPHGLGAHHASRHAPSPCGDTGGSANVQQVSDSTLDPSRLAVWTEFHRAIDGLDDHDRELFDLLWYQGLTQSETAAMLGLSERTVHKRWLVARVRLSDALGGMIPS